MGSTQASDASVTDSTQILNNIVKQHAAFMHGDQGAREAVVASCFKLITELEAPGETVIRSTWAQLSLLSALRTAVSLDLFKHIVSDNNAPMTCLQLAEATKCDAVLIARLMRTIGTHGFVHEVDEETYVGTPLTRAMTLTHYQDTIEFMVDSTFPSYQKVSDFLHDIKYQNPTNPLDSPFQYVNDCRGQKHFFQTLEESGAVSRFQNMMKVWHGERSHWSDEKAGFYPLSERLVQGARRGPKEAFLVDIGGGHGDDMVRLLSHHPLESLPGRLVLQDQPQVVGSIATGTLPDQVEVQGYDFYTPQPVKGARTYFMHNIVHDYPDETAKKILKQVAGAMEQGYSKLLLWEQVVPNTGADMIMAALDWTMLTFLAGCERTERQWRALIEDPDIGLKVLGIWYHGPNDQALIEIELA